MTKLDDLLADPGWFPEAMDTGRDTLRFARVSRDGLAKTPFLDQRMAPVISDRRDVRLSEALAAWDADKARKVRMPAFLFHSAFCCSTLLAKALDAPGACLALKEPDILMHLANALRVDEALKRDPARAKRLSAFIFGLLGRQFAKGERVLVKPTNSGNNLITPVREAGAPALLLYGDLRSFLISVIKKGEPCKGFMRLQYNIFSLDPGGLGAIPHRQAMGFTDLQVAALVWRHQMEAFAGALERDRDLASLDFTALLDRPEAVLTAVSRHLKLRHGSARIAAAATGPVFRENSKDAGEAYDPERRERDAAALEATHKDTLDLIEPWAAKLTLSRPASLPLPHPLDIAAR
ncbi:hypothetical protein [Hyphobacterium marinum]|uniref:Uncharacterized protein n=1 Tax=Hyphobacterium marinum TaxID=3116574 RepID=A0ABU7M035_9PROT|nr:hypothetical protein [Hyphobacterium sp. Y6023]MEE2566625.1 hypothetical protein [Hyphobacterium sp. Y6023]